ncbi:MAG: CDP-alcohol phosphatidyltransferase family protein [Anaerolineales bacterium]|nr:CDP-alcohol phosphatidyltransferase family protein [Anaerolineales bacterium]
MEEKIIKGLDDLTSLRVRLVGIMLLSGLVTFGVFVLFDHVWDIQAGLTWMAAAIGAEIYLFGSVWTWLDQNHRAGESQLLPTFGAGNLLSITRAVLIGLLAGFVFVPQPEGLLAWLPFALYLLADLTDFFDGYLARISNHATKLGETLDMNLDSLGVLVVTLLAFHYGTVPVWYLPVGFARYIFLFGIWLRNRNGQPVYDLRPSNRRRIFAGIQMGFVTAMLAPVLSPPGTTIAAAIFMLPFMVGFIYDWLQVSGRIGPSKHRAGEFTGKLKGRLFAVVPVVLRGIAVAVLIVWITQTSFDFPGTIVFMLLEIVIALFLGLGILTRVSAIAALSVMGIKLQFVDFGGLHLFYLLAASGVLFLGPGNYYVWSPEEWLFHHRAGETSNDEHQG